MTEVARCVRCERDLMQCLVDMSMGLECPGPPLRGEPAKGLHHHVVMKGKLPAATALAAMLMEHGDVLTEPSVDLSLKFATATVDALDRKLGPKRRLGCSRCGLDFREAAEAPDCGGGYHDFVQEDMRS